MARRKRSAKKRRIGILGGTFNPPHVGHLALAAESLRRLKLEKVIFVPTLIPPHKKIGDNNALRRYKMVSLACKDNPKFEVSKIELKRKSVSYSVETLRRLKKKYGKNAELFFITGSDSLDELESWKNIDEILKLANFIVALRPGFPIKKLRRGIKLIKIPVPDISSSTIRERARLSRQIRSLVPESVRRYIIKNKLYQ